MRAAGKVETAGARARGHKGPNSVGMLLALTPYVAHQSNCGPMKCEGDDEKHGDTGLGDQDRAFLARALCGLGSIEIFEDAVSRRR